MSKIPRKLWVNTKKKTNRADTSFNSFVEMPAVDQERELWPMYVDGTLYAMALREIHHASMHSKDEVTKATMTDLLIRLSEA